MLPASLQRNTFVQEIKARIFGLTGHKYPSRWYSAYRTRELKRVLSCPFDPEHLPAHYGRWLDERIIEYPWLLSRLPAGDGRLLDAGSVLNFDLLLQQPTLKEKDVTIMTLAPESDCFWRYGVSYVYGDLRDTGFRDDYFDFVACISTLEHVGLDNTLLYTSDASKKESNPESCMAAVAELRRILKPSGTAYITVPFGRRDVRSWLQVFDAPTLDSLIAAFQPQAAQVNYFRYRAEDGWRLCSCEAAADARYFDPRTDTPWEGRPVGAEAVACLELKK
jgi:SAM-dependent methyltransferase